MNVELLLVKAERHRLNVLIFPGYRIKGLKLGREYHNIRNVPIANLFVMYYVAYQQRSYPISLCAQDAGYLREFAEYSPFVLSKDKKR